MNFPFSLKLFNCDKMDRAARILLTILATGCVRPNVTTPIYPPPPSGEEEPSLRWVRCKNPPILEVSGGAFGAGHPVVVELKLRKFNALPKLSTLTVNGTETNFSSNKADSKKKKLLISDCFYLARNESFGLTAAVTGCHKSKGAKVDMKRIIIQCNLFNLII